MSRVSLLLLVALLSGCATGMPERDQKPDHWPVGWTCGHKRLGPNDVVMAQQFAYSADHGSLEQAKLVASLRAYSAMTNCVQRLELNRLISFHDFEYYATQRSHPYEGVAVWVLAKGHIRSARSDEDKSKKEFSFGRPESETTWRVAKQSTTRDR